MLSLALASPKNNQAKQREYVQGDIRYDKVRMGSCWRKYHMNTLGYVLSGSHQGCSGTTNHAIKHAQKTPYEEPSYNTVPRRSVTCSSMPRT